MTCDDAETAGDSVLAADATTVEYDWRDGAQPATAIAETVGTATDCDPVSLPPLHDSLDTEALNRVMTQAASNGTAVRMSFAYAGTEVFLDSEGLVTVRITDDDG